MTHVVEVDQSGKVEDTRLDTIVAFANGITFSVRIPGPRVVLEQKLDQG